MDKLIEWLDLPSNSQQKLADLVTEASEIRVTQPAVSQWIAKGKIPAERVLTVARIIGATPNDLRPDLYPTDGIAA